MPTYLYKHTGFVGCHLDNIEFEIYQGINDLKLERCPKCNNSVERLIAGSVLVSWKGGAPTSKNFV